MQQSGGTTSRRHACDCDRLYSAGVAKPPDEMSSGGGSSGGAEFTLQVQETAAQEADVSSEWLLHPSSNECTERKRRGADWHAQQSLAKVPGTLAA